MRKQYTTCSSRMTWTTLHSMKTRVQCMLDLMIWSLQPFHHLICNSIEDPDLGLKLLYGCHRCSLVSIKDSEWRM